MTLAIEFLEIITCTQFSPAYANRTNPMRNEHPFYHNTALSLSIIVKSKPLYATMNGKTICMNSS